MLKGLHLTMLAGPVIPIPLPQVVTDAITSVVVDADDDGTTFQVSFSLGKRSILETIFLLSGGIPIPLRVVLIATYNGLPEVLVDGLIRNTQVTPGSGGAATLTISGSDLTAAMDLQEFTGLPYPAMPVEARVALIVAKYAFLGIIPMVIPTAFPDLPLPIERIPVHHGTDLAYVRSLAADVGYCFHMLTPAPLVNIAYWGPKLRVGLPQAALNIDMDAYTNLESVHFDFANSGRELPVLMVPIPETTQWLPLPLPDISLLNPPLGLIEPLPSSIRFMPDVGGLSPIQIALFGLAQASESADTTTASGSLDVVQYGGVLKARSLVGMRGAGPGFDGLYYAKHVTHQISRGEYKQSFNLVRNGLVSITPRVPV